MLSLMLCWASMISIYKYVLCVRAPPSGFSTDVHQMMQSYARPEVQWDDRTNEWFTVTRESWLDAPKLRFRKTQQQTLSSLCFFVLVVFFHCCVSQSLLDCGLERHHLWFSYTPHCVGRGLSQQKPLKNSSVKSAQQAEGGACFLMHAFINMPWSWHGLHDHGGWKVWSHNERADQFLRFSVVVNLYIYFTQNKTRRVLPLS